MANTRKAKKPPADSKPPKRAGKKSPDKSAGVNSSTGNTINRLEDAISNMLTALHKVPYLQGQLNNPNSWFGQDKAAATIREIGHVVNGYLADIDLMWQKLNTRPSTPGAECGGITAASFCEVAIDIAAGFVAAAKFGNLKQPFKGVDDNLLPELLTQVSVELRALSSGRIMQQPQTVQPPYTAKRVEQNGKIYLQVLPRSSLAKKSNNDSADTQRKMKVINETKDVLTKALLVARLDGAAKGKTEAEIHDEFKKTYRRQLGSRDSDRKKLFANKARNVRRRLEKLNGIE